METNIERRLLTVLTWLTVVVILKVTGSVVLGYVDYFPPDFRSNFLQGRAEYFWRGYQYLFYLHIAAGPVSLILGTLLLNRRLRQRHPRWHRWLGRVQVANVLCLVVPSGFLMAFRAAAGPWAAAGFALLAVLTGVCIGRGWRTAVQRRFAAHERWMMRGFLLLCSAVTLRLCVGLVIVLEVYPVGIDVALAWLSWLVPLAIYEVFRVRKQSLSSNRRAG